MRAGWLLLLLQLLRGERRSGIWMLLLLLLELKLKLLLLLLLLEVMVRFSGNGVQHRLIRRRHRIRNHSHRIHRSVALPGLGHGGRGEANGGDSNVVEGGGGGSSGGGGGPRRYGSSEIQKRRFSLCFFARTFAATWRRRNLACTLRPTCIMCG